jgi:hypothetical protein
MSKDGNSDLVAASVQAVMKMHWPASVTFGDVVHDPCRGLDMHHFDITTSRGKVFRVRVSDITPSDGG